MQTDSLPIPLELFVQAKAKDPPSDAMPKFLNAYSATKRLGALTKEAQSGQMIDEWGKAVSSADTKPEMVDVSPFISSLLAVKDEEELVRRFVRDM